MENIEPSAASLGLALDPTHIPANDLTIALANAALDPDGQVYPWRPGYPLVGATVVYGDRLWTVAGKERGPGADEPTAIVRLDGQGHDGRDQAVAYELRPVTWTLADEIALELARAGGAS